jgi:YggT family protein
MILIHYLLQLLVFVIIIDVLLSWVPQYRSQKWAQTIHDIAEVPQKPIRELLPKDLPLDPTPMVVIMLIHMFQYLLRAL